MKRMILWSAGLILTGVALWWGSQTPVLAGGYSHNHFIGGRGESISDNSPERSGFDRHADRVPDGDSAGSASDRGGNDGDGTASGTPDCNDGPGDGSNIGTPCGNPTGVGDLTPDYHGMSDANGPNTSNEKPDYRAAINRIGDEFSDSTPEWKNSDHGDSVSDRVALKDCADPGECKGRPNKHSAEDFYRDRDGRDGLVNSQDRVSDSTPDRQFAGHDDPKRPERDGDSNGGQGDATPGKVAQVYEDSIRDGIQDRANVDRGSTNLSQKARDAHAFGAGDATHDRLLGGGADRANFGYAGGGGGGCSLVAGTSTNPASGLAYLLVLLTPAAVVVIRRIARRK
jgi:hypothetical protein